MFFSDLLGGMEVDDGTLGTTIDQNFCYLLNWKIHSLFIYLFIYLFIHLFIFRLFRVDWYLTLQ